MSECRIPGSSDPPSPKPPPDAPRLTGEILVDDGETRRRYYLPHPSGEVAELIMSKSGPDLLIIEHTEVPTVFRGQGVGTKLVECAVADARTSGARILPLCSFAAAQFRRNRDWADVLKGGITRRDSGR